MKTPKVMIIIATDILGGPGKGVFQLIDRLHVLNVSYVLAAFKVAGRNQSEFISLAKAKNYNLELIEQNNSINSSLFRQAKSIISKYDINIVQTHGYKSHLIGLYSRWVIKLPWVAFAHGWTSENLKVRFYNLIEILVFRLANRKITVSPSIQRMLSKWLVTNTEVILNAVDKSEIRESENMDEIRNKFHEGGKFAIGVIGRLSPEKGHNHLFHALKKINDRRFRVIVVGDGPELNKLKKLVSDLGIKDHVVFYGYSENPGDIYQAIDLLVLPSLKEGLPNVVLESMAYGVPVISTNVGGVSEIITDGVNGWLVKPSDSDELANAILNVLNNTEEFVSVKNRVVASIFPKFSPELRAETIVSVYRELLV